LFEGEQTRRVLGKTALYLKGYKIGEESERKHNAGDQRKITVNNMA
jgi:hypothetical protein